MDERVEELLTLWGDCMRRAPGVPRLGYPQSSIGGHLLGRRPSGRSATEPQQTARFIRDEHGKLQRVPGAALHMVPAAQPKETRTNRAWTPSEWPELVDDVDRIIAKMTPREQRAIRLKYWHMATQLEASQAMGISVSLYKRIVAEAQRFFAGYLKAAA